jgi:hypothetical protein
VFVHGQDTFVSLDGNDLSTYSKTTDFTDTTEVHDVTTYGNSRKRKHGGLGDGTVTIGGVYDNSATGPRAVIKPIKALGLPVPFIFQPEGAGAGKAQSLVDVVVASYKESAPVDDMVTWEAELDMDGDLDEDPQ